MANKSRSISRARRPKPNQKIEKFNAAVVPEVKCAYEQLGIMTSKTPTALFDEATELLFKKHGVTLPTREAVATWFGPEWVKKHNYKVQNGGDAAK